jgi:hypothetical protein
MTNPPPAKSLSVSDLSLLVGAKPPVLATPSVASGQLFLSSFSSSQLYNYCASLCPLIYLRFLCFLTLIFSTTVVGADTRKHKAYIWSVAV